MNVTIICGTTTKSNTYNCVELLLSNLRLKINIKVTKIILPKDISRFCYEHLSCFVNNGNTYSDLNNISKSLNESDLIILACPVLLCDISAEMKLFLDYLSYESLQSETKSMMCNKIGLVMSTATGAGLFHTIRTLKRTMNLWGISNTFTFSKTLYEMDWEDVTLKNKMHIIKKLFKLSNKIINIYNNSHSIKNHIFSETPVSHNKAMLNKYPCNVIDFKHLKNQSCLESRNI